MSGLDPLVLLARLGDEVRLMEQPDLELKVDMELELQLQLHYQITFQAGGGVKLLKMSPGLKTYKLI